MSTEWTFWRCERISWECLNVHAFQNPMWCLPIPLSHWVPLKLCPLGLTGWNVHLFSVFYLLTMSLHSHLHAVSKVSSPCFSLHREVSWLQNKMDPNPVFKARCTLCVAGVLCEQENGKLQSPHWNSWLLTVCLEQLLRPSFEGGGGCQTLREDLFSFLVMLRKGDHEKWRKAGGSFIASTWKYA